MTDTFDNKPVISSFGLEDVDRGFYNWWDTVLNLHSTNKNGEKRKVPVRFWSAERWYRAREEGTARDDNGQVIAPIIIVSRVGTEDSTTGPQSRTFADIQDSFTIHKEVDRKSSKVKNLINSRDFTFEKNRPIYEVYTIPVPDHYKLTYEVSIWTPYMEDLNNFVQKIGQQMTYKSKKIFPFDIKDGLYLVAHKSEDVGDESNLDDFTKEERILRKEFTFEVSAHIVPESDERTSKMKRYWTQSRLVIKESVPTQEDLAKYFKK